MTAPDPQTTEDALISTANSLDVLCKLLGDMGEQAAATVKLYTYLYTARQLDMIADELWANNEFRPARAVRDKAAVLRASI